MLSTIEQFVFTSFDDTGFTSVCSDRFPKELHHTIQNDLISRYWDTYQPPPVEFVGVYLHQINERQTLFGWLYDEAGDAFGRSHVPYFLVYFSDNLLDRRLLDDMMCILERGPLQKIQRAAKPFKLEQIVVDSVFKYTSQGLGVPVPRSIRLECYAHLRTGSKLHFFTPPIYTVERLKVANILDVSLSKLTQRCLKSRARYYDNLNIKRLSALFVRTQSLASKENICPLKLSSQDDYDNPVVEQKMRCIVFLSYAETMLIIAPLSLFVVLTYSIAFASILRLIPSEIEVPIIEQSRLSSNPFNGNTQIE